MSEFYVEEGGEGVSGTLATICRAPWEGQLIVVDLLSVS